MDITTVVLLLLTHLIADFFLQSDWMALNKSKDPLALLAHTGVYGLCFLPFGFEFAFVTFTLHTITDAISSQVTSKLWFVHLRELHEPFLFKGKFYNYYAGLADEKRHWFFVTIGVDQFLHYVMLLYVYQFMRG